MKLRKQCRDLMKLIHGGRVFKPPFWEVWFGMQRFFQHRYGDPTVQNRIRMAEDLGMAIIPLGGIDTNVWFQRREETSTGLSRYAGGQLESLRQLEERPIPDFKPIVERLRPDQQNVRESGFVSWVVLPWCFHAVATSMGLRNFIVRLHRDREFIEHAFDWVEERNRLAIDKVVRKVRPDLVLFDGDCAYKTGLMVNPEIFRELVVERTRKTVSRLRSLGIPYAFHTDGKLDDVIPILVELGFSAVHGCERTANDLGDLVERFGDEIVLVGNMDVTTLYLSTPQRIRAETERMLMEGSKKGRFVAACNTSPLDNIPTDNYLAFVDAIRDFSPRLNRES